MLNKIVPVTNIVQMAVLTVLTHYASVVKTLHLRTGKISKRAKQKRASTWGSVLLIAGMTRLVKIHASNVSSKTMENAHVKLVLVE